MVGRAYKKRNGISRDAKQKGRQRVSKKNLTLNFTASP